MHYSVSMLLSKKPRSYNKGKKKQLKDKSHKLPNQQKNFLTDFNLGNALKLFSLCPVCPLIVSFQMPLQI